MALDPKLLEQLPEELQNQIQETLQQKVDRELIALRPFTLEEYVTMAQALDRYATEIASSSATPEISIQAIAHIQGIVTQLKQRVRLIQLGIMPD